MAVRVQPQIVLTMFLFWRKFQPQYSYKIVLIKKRVYCLVIYFILHLSNIGGVDSRGIKNSLYVGECPVNASPCLIFKVGDVKKNNK